MSERLLPERLLFRYSLPCRYRHPLWTSSGAKLDDSHRLPPLAELEGLRCWADVRVAWSEEGLALAAHVRGKRRPPRCDDGRPLESDHLRVWIDTRDTHNVHRATRFCHEFIFLPQGGGRQRRDPCGEQLFIHRAKENARRVPPTALSTRSQILADGYELDVLIPGAVLTGWDPAEHPRVGFTYALRDHELGWQSFSSGDEFPYAEDPSLWATLELAK